MIIDNTLKTVAYLVACLETAGKQTTAYERAKTVTEDVVNQMPLTAGDWTKAFLVSHYFVFYVVEGLLPDNAGELMGKAVDKTKAYAVEVYNKATTKGFTPEYTPYDTAVDLTMSYSAAVALLGVTNEEFDLLLSSGIISEALVVGMVLTSDVMREADLRTKGFY